LLESTGVCGVQKNQAGHQNTADDSGRHLSIPDQKNLKTVVSLGCSSLKKETFFPDKNQSTKKTRKTTKISRNLQFYLDCQVNRGPGPSMAITCLHSVEAVQQGFSFHACDLLF